MDLIDTGMRLSLVDNDQVNQSQSQNTKLSNQGILDLIAGIDNLVSPFSFCGLDKWNHMS